MIVLSKSISIGLMKKMQIDVVGRETGKDSDGQMSADEDYDEEDDGGQDN